MGTARHLGPRRFLLAALASAGFLAGCGSSHPRAVAPPRPTAPSAPPSTAAPSPTTSAPPGPPVCPLTALPPPGGQVPQRPALAVKVENLPAARPQYGLSQADVIYEEPVEGGITRFIAIYQCHDSNRIEPVRSGRLMDPQIVSQFGAHPLLAYAGAIPPATAAIDNSSLIDVGVFRAPASAYPRDPSRSAPHNLMTSTAPLYAYAAGQHADPTPPPPVFTFGAVPAGAKPASSLHITFEYADFTWTWNPTTNAWQRSYADTGLAALGEGGSITTTNIIVMHVQIFPSPYVEDATGAREFVGTFTGSGAAEIYRNGQVVAGTWNRPTLTDNTTYKDPSGQVIPLQPGQTWVELVPQNVPAVAAP